jgi:acetoin utilization protein AcuC
MDSAILIYDDAYRRYDFGPEHPFDPLRLRLAIDLLRTTGLLPDSAIQPPRLATHDELLLVHDPAYIEAVTRLSVPDASCDAEVMGLCTPDVPIFPGMHEAAALVAGGTLRATELVMTGAAHHAFNIAGGHHHAQRALASGFSIYNDAAVAIAWATRRFGARVLYIDTDAHHGDGVQNLFEERADVLTISFHESGRSLYPGTGCVAELGRGAGYGYAVNVPLEPFTDDASWIALFDAVVPPLARAFRPDLIVHQNGCDGHALDPLTHLRATTRTVEHVTQAVHALAHQLCDGRLVMLGGGGYAIWRVVPRAWTLAWSILSGQPAPETLPEAWRARWAPHSPVPLPTRLRDDPADYPPLARQHEIAAANQATLRHLQTLLPALSHASSSATHGPPPDPKAGW